MDSVGRAFVSSSSLRQLKDDFDDIPSPQSGGLMSGAGTLETNSQSTDEDIVFNSGGNNICQQPEGGPRFAFDYEKECPATQAEEQKVKLEAEEQKSNTEEQVRYMGERSAIEGTSRMLISSVTATQETQGDQTKLDYHHSARGDSCKQRGEVEDEKDPYLQSRQKNPFSKLYQKITRHIILRRSRAFEKSKVLDLDALGLESISRRASFQERTGPLPMKRPLSRGAWSESRYSHRSLPSFNSASSHDSRSDNNPPNNIIEPDNSYITSLRRRISFSRLARASNTVPESEMVQFPSTFTSRTSRLERLFSYRGRRKSRLDKHEEAMDIKRNSSQSTVPQNLNLNSDYRFDLITQNSGAPSGISIQSCLRDNSVFPLRRDTEDEIWETRRIHDMIHRERYNWHRQSRGTFPSSIYNYYTGNNDSESDNSNVNDDNAGEGSSPDQDAMAEMERISEHLPEEEREYGSIQETRETGHDNNDSHNTFFTPGLDDNDGDHSFTDAASNSILRHAAYIQRDEEEHRLPISLAEIFRSNTDGHMRQSREATIQFLTSNDDGREWQSVRLRRASDVQNSLLNRNEPTSSQSYRVSFLKTFLSRNFFPSLSRKKPKLDSGTPMPELEMHYSRSFRNMVRTLRFKKHKSSKEQVPNGTQVTERSKDLLDMVAANESVIRAPKADRDNSTPCGKVPSPYSDKEMKDFSPGTPGMLSLQKSSEPSSFTISPMIVGSNTYYKKNS